MKSMRLKGRIVWEHGILQAIRNSGRMVTREMQKTLRLALVPVQDRAKELVGQGPGGKHKERLSKRIIRRVKGMRGIVGSYLWYARVQEEGSAYLPGGVIKARDRASRRVKTGPDDTSGAKTKRVKLTKPRRWMQFQIGGRWIRTAQVKVPGKFYLKRGLQQSLGAVQRIINEGAKRIAQQFTRGGG